MAFRNVFVDIVISFLLILTTVFFAQYFVDFSITPFEDAAMLMRYASHFSEGHGIVWNIGEAPVDGATDFLFMVVVGLLARAGLSVESVVRAVGFSAHLMTILVIYMTFRRIHSSGIYSATLSSLYFAIGPGLFFVAAYFGTPFFTLAVCMTWMQAMTVIAQPDSAVKRVAFSVLSLLMGLIRPEGVFLAAFMLLSLITILGFEKSKPTVLAFLLIYALLGGAYFFWRWHYFGYPLPNPFYKKGGGLLYPQSLQDSVKYVRRLCLPFMPVFLPGICCKEMRKKTIALLIPIIGFTSIWILLSKEMNFGGRFQYPILPVVLLAWYPLAKELPLEFVLFKRLRSKAGMRRLLVLIAFVLFMGILHYQYRCSQRITYHKDGRYNMAMILQEYHKKGYTIATTEAGLLPLYSQWRAVDAWGLNDQWITHNQGITEEYLLKNSPQILMWHEDRSPGISHKTPRDLEWLKMLETLRNYAHKHHYELAASFGELSQKTHIYYVSKNFPDSQEIIKKIRSVDYFWYQSGRKSTNFALNRQK